MANTGVIGIVLMIQPAAELGVHYLLYCFRSRKNERGIVSAQINNQKKGGKK